MHTEMDHTMYGVPLSGNGVTCCSEVCTDFASMAMLSPFQEVHTGMNARHPYRSEKVKKKMCCQLTVCTAWGTAKHHIPMIM